MAKGDSRRGRKKYRVRYDRLVVFLLIIVTIAVLASSCVNKIRGVDNKANAPEIPKTTTTAPNKEQQTTAPKTEDTTTSTLETATSANAEFTTVTYAAEEAYKGDLVLVNNDCEYMFPEGDIDPITIVGNRNDYYQAGDYVTKLDKEVLEQLNILMEDYAKAQGKTTTDVFVQDGFRTYDEQVRRHSEGKSKTFTAGHTDYHTGRTFDMFLMDSDSSTGYVYFTADEWFSKNCGTYGFILRYPEGKQEETGEKPRTYTYRYVGFPHASYINEQQICFEEYIEKVKGHTIDEPLEFSANGQKFNVYFVPMAENGGTDIPVPMNKTYTVSGSNAGGFIVTVAVD
ncbi:MAG: D-alanyl-D-alanine carboxypeptidase family protein [Ruminococcus sp.]|nr:D-alanyl-D-alanine carboxypeptidase family protein [Ruminococcus sp.]